MVKVREDMTGWKMWEHGFKDSRIIVVKQADDYVSPKGLHYARWWCKCNCGNQDIFIVKSLELRNGDTQSCGCLRVERSRTRQKRYNNFQLNFSDEKGLYGVGYCHNTNREFYFDMEDYDKIKDYCWFESVYPDGYRSVEAWEGDKKSQVRMHQIIVGKYCDHEDRDPFNNRKYNLRNATSTENARNKSLSTSNTSGVIGVSFDKENSKWRAYIGIDRKAKKLGRYCDKDDAIRARLQAEAKYYDKFAPQKHLFEQYGIECKDEFIN
jgi:hypothetical protein